jgi:hypothetical protein
MTHRSPIPPLPPITAPIEIIDQARINVIRRLTQRGNTDAASRIAGGMDTNCWAMRHEVARLEMEAGA